MSNQQPKRFDFKTAKIISIAITGVALMLLGRFIIQGLASTLWLNNCINGDAFLAVMNSELALSLVIRSVGVGLFLFSMYRVYVNRSAFTFKAFKKTLILSSMLCLVVIMSSTVVEAPLVAADKVNTISQGYKLCISMGYYDYWIGQLSNDQYFAIRGSDGNAMTFVEPWQASPPWAAYASNYTALEQQVFASMTYGTVYSKEVPFNYNLTIPANTRFIENVNGLERNFVSVSSSQGSPYTVSVDTVNSGYYVVQDSQDRFINSWSSTNASIVIQSACDTNLNTGAPLSISINSYIPIDNTIYPHTNTTLYSDINGAGLSMPVTVEKAIIMVNNTRNVKIMGLTINHNDFATYADDDLNEGYCINGQNASDTEIGFCHIIGGEFYNIGFGLDRYEVTDDYLILSNDSLPSDNLFIHDNLIERSPKDGINISGGSGHRICDNIIQDVVDDAIALYGWKDHHLTNTDVSDNLIQNCSRGTSSSAFKLSVARQQMDTGCVSGVNIHGNVVNNVASSVLNLWISTPVYSNNVVAYSNISFTNNVANGSVKQGILAVFLANTTGGQRTYAQIKIEGNTFTNCGIGTNMNGFDLSYLVDSSFSNNVISHCGNGTGSQDLVKFVRCNNTDIKDNIILSGTGHSAIFDYSGIANRISGNRIDTATNTSIHMGDTSAFSNSSIIENNIINYATQYSILLYGDYADIFHNTIGTSGTESIRISVSGQNTTVTDNRITKTGTTIHDLGVGSIIKNNIINGQFCINGTTPDA